MTKIRRLLKVTLRPTSECNRGCSDCYDDARLKKNAVEFTEAQQGAFVDEISTLIKEGVRVLIHLTGGGEPLLYSRFVPLVESLLNAGTLVSFTTSGCSGLGSHQAVDFLNLLQVAEIRNKRLQPILSTKVTLPGWHDRFRFSADLLGGINGLVKVRRTNDRYGNESEFADFLGGLGYRETDMDEISGVQLPPGFYRKDLIVPGQEESQTLYINEGGMILQVISHKTIKAGRAKRNNQVMAQDATECPFLTGHEKPYLDIWPNGAIYPCFITGPEIPNLSLGNLGQTTLKEALQNDDFEERKHRFRSGSPGDCLCDMCRG